jgi:hypothetical protein
LLLSAWLFVQALPRVAPGNRPEGAAPQRLAPVPALAHSKDAGRPRQRFKKIEEIRVGDRVWAHNPELDEATRSTPDPDPATWRQLKLFLFKPDGRRVDAELLRPVEWVEREWARAGGQVYLDLPEMGCVGWATVVSIGPCPAIAPGGGRVVTGTYVHQGARNVLDLRLEGLTPPIGVTANHPIYSVDRKAFVPAGDLAAGERVQPAFGPPTTVVATTPRPGTHTVYNFEVHVEHVYHVSRLGLLVHNTTPPPPNSENPPPSPPGSQRPVVQQSAFTEGLLGPAGARKVLVVGESGTFEYSIELAKQNPEYQVTATTYGKATPPTPEGGLPKNLTIVTEVDATKLDTHFGAGQFNDVVFTAPRAHPGWIPESGTLVDDVLRSATKVVAPDGTVRFASSGGMPAGPRLFGHAKGGEPEFPIPEGWETPLKAKYLEDRKFGVDFTPRNNDGKALGTKLSEIYWFIFPRKRVSPK